MNALHQVVTTLLLITTSLLAGVTLRNIYVELRTKVRRPGTIRTALLCLVCAAATIFMAGS